MDEQIDSPRLIPEAAASGQASSTAPAPAQAASSAQAVRVDFRMVLMNIGWIPLSVYVHKWT